MWFFSKYRKLFAKFRKFRLKVWLKFRLKFWQKFRLKFRLKFPLKFQLKFLLKFRLKFWPKQSKFGWWRGIFGQISNFFFQKSKFFTKNLNRRKSFYANYQTFPLNAFPPKLYFLEIRSPKIQNPKYWQKSISHFVCQMLRQNCFCSPKKYTSGIGSKFDYIFPKILNLHQKCGKREFSRIFRCPILVVGKLCGTKLFFTKYIWWKILKKNIWLCPLVIPQLLYQNLKKI